MITRTPKENIVRLYEADRKNCLDLGFYLDAINFFCLGNRDDDNCFNNDTAGEENYMLASELLLDCSEFYEVTSTAIYMDYVITFRDYFICRYSENNK